MQHVKYTYMYIYYIGLLTIANTGQPINNSNMLSAGLL